MPGQFEGVALALAQRRQLDGKLRQPVVEVFAELAIADQQGEVTVGSGDDAYIDLVRVVAAERANLAFLQHAQQLGLERQGHVADFVEQQGSAIRGIEQPGTIALGTGKGALAVAEQLAFQQVSGNAAQFCTTNACARRGPYSWIARATTSLPVPVSPCSNTV